MNLGSALIYCQCCLLHVVDWAVISKENMQPIHFSITISIILILLIDHIGFFADVCLHWFGRQFSGWVTSLSDCDNSVWCRCTFLAKLSNACSHGKSFNGWVLFLLCHTIRMFCRFKKGTTSHVFYLLMVILELWNSHKSKFPFMTRIRAAVKK